MNLLEERANELYSRGQFQEACNIYIFMADGDASLDAGYLGMRLGECYERLNRRVEAKYWYNRAEEENPGVREQVKQAILRLRGVSIDDLL
jgi:tetratricopeptide (TPR) repeat protein